MKITVTGAAGYIGSHACLSLLDAGHDVHGLDNFSRSFPRTVAALERVGRDHFHFTQVELCDPRAAEAALQSRPPEIVLHFAALAVVPESVASPQLYWRNNVEGTASLLTAMEGVHADKLIFSSSCATYGEPAAALMPIAETCPQHPTHPYGRSKLACEQLVDHWVRCGSPDRGAVILRYFNVAGGDRLGRLGEDHEPETHLFPNCLRAAAGRLAELVVHGGDFPTPDGTCVRDYVHVEDLVDAHLEAIKVMPSRSATTLNVGTGHGASVLEVLKACEAAAGRPIPFRLDARRAGDPPTLVCDPRKILSTTSWRPTRSSLDSIARSAWMWIQSRG
ncbi:MAG: UDP-glucose 4-epimerase GalE [Planctomycetes bacterium]|nr:UDP-glucose 4-epimerase GalE [Planctomycetota bacterium]